jgi:hypothetical protein
VNVLATQLEVSELAERIEQAYRLRRPDWVGTAMASRVWSAAASVLLRVHEKDKNCPIDPELFVASQSLESSVPDPWFELTQIAASESYQAAVHTIIQSLRSELRRELRRVERLLEAGEPLTKVLRSPKVSPLAKYLAAIQEGRSSLAMRLLPGVQEQSAACPLYRQACAKLVPASAFAATAPAFSTGHKTLTPRKLRAQINLN